MRRIIFSCKWQKNHRTSWSGTHYAIYSRLQRRYEVVNFDTGFFNLRPASLWIRIRKHLGLKRPRNLYLWNIERYNKIARRRFARGKYACVQFEESPNQSNIKSFIFQDFSVCYTKRAMDEHPERYVPSFWGSNPETIAALDRSMRTFYANENVTVLTMGRWFAKWLVEECGVPAARVHAIGGGCNIPTDAIDGSKRQGNKILFVGRVLSFKNGELVLEAFRLAQAQRRDLELYVVGPTSLEGCEDVENLHFEGRRSYAELPRYYNLCDVFCLPSKFDAYGIAFVEALIYGLPCIGRDAFEMPYFIEEGETGYLLRNETPEELAELMLKAVANREMRENVERRREWYLKEYSWDAVVERMAKIIDAETE